MAIITEDNLQVTVSQVLIQGNRGTEDSSHYPQMSSRHPSSIPLWGEIGTTSKFECLILLEVSYYMEIITLEKLFPTTGMGIGINSSDASEKVNPMQRD